MPGPRQRCQRARRPPTYSINGSNAAQTTTATFSKAGTYVFQATITDTSGLTVTSSVTVAVNSTVESLSLSPGASTLPSGGQLQFTATTVDQFGNPFSPAALSWSVSSGGTISSTGLYNASAASGTVTVTASSGSVQGTASVTLAAPSTWWKFDDGTGTAASDSSGNGHAGTISNAAWTSGIYGDALQFNGTSSYVTSSTAALSGNGDFTVGAWVKTTAATAGVIIQQVGGTTYHGQYQLLMNAAGTVTFWVARYAGSSYQYRSDHQRQPDDQQRAVALRHGGARGLDGRYLYRRGRWRQRGDVRARTLSSSNEVSVGADAYDRNTYFNGTIDNVQIYATSITADGIASLATAAPTIAAAAAASPNPVTGTTTALSVLGGR